jgi:hypothetical protein
MTTARALAAQVAVAALPGPVDRPELVDGGRVLAPAAASRPDGGLLAGPAERRQPGPLATVELAGRLDPAAAGTALGGGHAAVPSEA